MLFSARLPQTPTAPTLARLAESAVRLVNAGVVPEKLVSGHAHEGPVLPVPSKDRTVGRRRRLVPKVRLKCYFAM